MKARNWWIAGVAAVGVAVALGMQVDGRNASGSLAYQGQNTGAFQMFFSPFTRQDSFLVNSTSGQVWVLKAAGDRNVFEPVAVSPAPGGGNQPGRYRIYFGSTVRADTFMTDTATGRVWTLISDQVTNVPYFSGTEIK